MRYAQRRNDTPNEEVVLDRKRIPSRRPAIGRPVIEGEIIAEHEHVGLPAEPHHVCQIVAVVLVVLVEIGKGVRTRHADGRIPGRAHPAVLIEPQRSNPRVLAGPLPQDIVAAVSGPVIDSHDLPAGEGLTVDRSQCAIQRGRAW